MTQPALSLDTRILFASSTREEECLTRLISRMTKSERRAFWLAALIVDKACNVEQALAYWSGEPIPDGPKRPPRNDGRRFRY